MKVQADRLHGSCVPGTEVLHRLTLQPSFPAGMTVCLNFELQSRVESLIGSQC